MRIIDFDDPSSFPEALSNWDLNFERMIRGIISLDGVTEGRQIEHQLSDLRIDEMPIVLNYLNTHLDSEVAVIHCTRIMDIEQFKKEGLITGGGRGSVADVRLRQLLKAIGLDSNMSETVMSNVYSCWDWGGEQRTECVHFQVDRNTIYKDAGSSAFACNLGGEVLEAAIEECGSHLYTTEPYKRLWIWGTPCIVKFKCKLADIHPTRRALLLAEIVKYSIVTKLFCRHYEFSFTGMTTGSVPPENIISVEEIKGFTELQEQYELCPGFYDELKPKRENDTF